MNSSIGFVTWQPVLTDHQAYTYLALEDLSGVKLLSFVTANEDPIRKSQGWTETRVDALKTELIPSKNLISYYYHQLQKYRHSVHIFASPFQELGLIMALFMGALMGVKLYLISEPYSPVSAGSYDDGGLGLSRLKSRLRPFLYWCYTLILRRRVSGIFAISRLSERQYRRAGMPVDKLFPFGYFVPRAPSKSTRPPAERRDNCPRFVFVGSLIRRKGVYLLIEAMRLINEKKVRCMMDFYGPGDPSFLVGCAGVRYCGKIPFGDAQEVISGYELLVLPSIHDGWGVVVNEAICAGVPVLCSDATGAGSVAAYLGAGRMFKSGSLDALIEAIEELIDHHDSLSSLKEATSSAASTLQPSIAAAYMLDIFNAPKEQRSACSSPWSSRG